MKEKHAYYFIEIIGINTILPSDFNSRRKRAQTIGRNKWVNKGEKITFRSKNNFT